MANNVFDPSQISFRLGGIKLTNFADDTFVTVARLGAAPTTTSGADGQNILQKTANKGATFTFTLAQTRRGGNRRMLDFDLEDEANGTPIDRPFTIRDPNSGLTLTGLALIQDKGVPGFAGTSQGRTWIIFTNRLIESFDAD